MADKAPKPVGRPPRRLLVRRRRTLVLELLAVLAVVGVVLWLALPGLARWAALRVLADRGLADADLTIETLSPGELVVTGLRIGAADPLTVGRLALTFGLGDLLDGRLEGLTVDNVRLGLAVAEDGAVTLPALAPLFTDTGEGGPPPRLAVGQIVLSAVRVEATSPWGDLAADLDGGLVIDTGGESSGALTLGGLANHEALGVVPLSGRLAFRGALPAIAFLDADLSLPGLPLPHLTTRDLRLTARLADDALAAVLVLDADEARLRADLSAPLAALADPVNGDLSAKVTGQVFQAPWPDLPVPLALDLTAQAAAGRADVTAVLTNGDNRLDLSGPVALAPLVAGKVPDLDLAYAVALRTAPVPDLPVPLSARGRAALAQDHLRLDADLKQGASTAQLALDAPLATLPDRLTLTGDVTLLHQALPGLPAPLTLRGQALTVARDGDRITLAATAPLAVTWHDAPAVAATLAAQQDAFAVVRLKAGAFDGLDLALDGLDVERDGLAVHLARGRGTVTAAGLALERAVLTLPQVPPPVTLSGTLDWSGPPLAFDLTARALDGKVVAQAKGRHQGTAGSADVTLHPVTFLPGLLQPKDLSPEGAQVSDVTGAVSAQGAVAWTADGVTSDLAAVIDDLSLTHDETKVTGIAGTLRLLRPWPPVTAPKQVITVQSVDPGQPAGPVKAVFSLAADGTVVLDNLTTDFVDGQVRTGGLTFDPAHPKADLVVDVDGLGIPRLLTLVDVAGLNGGGTLDGRLPIHLEDGGFSVTKGEIKARSPGVLSYKPA
ncbi:MAG: YdbH domain-containing protein, partial [Rhodobacterales bacterium]|nr:YdbH domain-containing protein [Rhodobacterales bacterium]